MSSVSPLPQVVRHVVVDDADGAIQYVGPGWSTLSGSSVPTSGNYGPVYDNTLHQINNTQGSSLRYQFNGTAVRVIGSIDKSGNKTLPSWQCFLDGKLMDKTSFPSGVTENHQMLCSINALTTEEHQLEVNVTTSGPVFYFDNIIYDPTPGVPLADAVVKVDNNDPSINLSGSGWLRHYNDEWSLTSHNGDQIEFEFVGRAVAFIGAAPGELNGNQTTGTYAIDGGKLTSFTVPGHAGLTEYNQLYFTTPKVAAGAHTLTVTYQGNANKAPLVLDSLLVANGTQTLSTVPNSSPSATSDAHSGSSAPVGAIVGGVVGGIILLLGAALAYLFYRRRRAPRRPRSLVIVDDTEDRPLSASDHTHSSITPFHADRSMSQLTDSDPVAAGAMAPSVAGAAGLQPRSEDVRSTEKRRAAAPGHATAPDRPPTTTPSSRPMPDVEAAPGRRFVHHEDSGVRMNEAAEEVVDVPPTYTAN